MAKGKLPKLLIGALSLGAICFAQSSLALTYHTSDKNNEVVGHIQSTTVMSGDTLERISREYDLGYNELASANPQVNPNRYLRWRQKLTVPTKYILPNKSERKGIVVNLPEMRLYYFPENERSVMTFPVGIGKINKTIPMGKGKVTRKKLNPTWRPTKSIRAFNEKRGVFLPASVPAGPNNPLGPYAIYLTMPQYLIHSTIHPTSIGKRSSFGCIRMYEEDVEQLFRRVGRNVPIHVVNESVKLGWNGNKLYMEVHSMLREKKFHQEGGLKQQAEAMLAKSKYRDAIINWKMVKRAISSRNGVPMKIGVRKSV
jgi:L,D-transpeptidase ErfK/SrfK